MVIALTARAWFLDGSLWLDEAAQALESARPFSQQLQIAADFQPPLLHLLLHVAMSGGRSEVWLRWWGALLPGLLTILALMVFGERRFGRGVGLLAGFLLAMNTFHVYYSQELRPYSLSALWAVVSWWCLVEWGAGRQVSARESDERSKHGRGKHWFVGWILSTLLGLYSSYVYGVVCIAQAVWAWWWVPKRRWYFLRGVAVVGGGVLPWAPFFLEQLHVGGQVQRALPTWSSVVGFSASKAVAMTLGKWLFGHVNLEITAPFVVASVFALSVITIMLLNTWRRVWHQPKNTLLGWSPEIWAIWCWSILPLVLASVLTLWLPILQPKRVLFLWPAWSLGVAWLMVRQYAHFAPQLRAELHRPMAKLLRSLLLKRTHETSAYRRNWTWQLAVSLLVLFCWIHVWGMTQYLRDAQLQREDWRGLVTELTQKYPKELSVAVFAFDAPFAPWRWYADPQYPTVAFSQLNITPAVLPALKSALDARYILVFEYLQDLSDPQRLIQQRLSELGYHEIDRLGRPGIGVVHVYTRSLQTIGVVPAITTRK